MGNWVYWCIRVDIPITSYIQSINLITLLIMGGIWGNFYLNLIDMISIILYALMVEHTLLYLNPNRRFYISYSSISTAVGVIFLAYSNSIWKYYLIILLGLLQKHFMGVGGKHLFNPSNFAIVVGMLLFYEDIHIISGQFGDSLIFSVVVSILASIILLGLIVDYISIFYSRLYNIQV